MEVVCQMNGGKKVVIKMKVVIKTYKPCEQCKGTGLEWQDQYSWDCRVCQGYG